MIQDLITYIVVAGAVITALISIFKNILPVKSHSGHAACDGCMGCELKDHYSGLKPLSDFRNSVE